MFRGRTHTRGEGPADAQRGRSSPSLGGSTLTRRWRCRPARGGAPHLRGALPRAAPPWMRPLRGAHPREAESGGRVPPRPALARDTGMRRSRRRLCGCLITARSAPCGRRGAAAPPSLAGADAAPPRPRLATSSAGGDATSVAGRARAGGARARAITHECRSKSPTCVFTEMLGNSCGAGWASVGGAIGGEGAAGAGALTRRIPQRACARHRRARASHSPPRGC
jgi:hypothetical protein